MNIPLVNFASVRCGLSQAGTQRKQGTENNKRCVYVFHGRLLRLFDDRNWKIQHCSENITCNREALHSWRENRCRA